MEIISTDITFYSIIIRHLEKAFSVLDGQGREEVLKFVIGEQNSDGGFRDRGNSSDLYYSLFGLLLLRAFRFNDSEYIKVNQVSISLELLKNYASSKSNGNPTGFIEKCCLVLLQKELKICKFSRFKSLLLLGQSFWKERYSINVSYRSFVLFLTLDAVLPFRRILISGAKRMMAKTFLDENSPSSEVAAKLFLKKMTMQNGTKEEELLRKFACESGGFKAFLHIENADMLSTAVALFALKFSEADLRLLKPCCLGFIEENYTDGAFISGDSDLTRDVEYTFYGLLALGVLTD